MRKLFIIIILFIANRTFTEIWFPCPKPVSGNLEFSTGVHFWDDHLYIRNLQLRALVYLYPGLRCNGVFRGNKQINQVEFSREKKPGYYKLQPHVDELYVEFFGFADMRQHNLSASLRLGEIRYFRFPNYGLISRMDQVAGMADIRSKYTAAAYRGAMLHVDYTVNNIAGFHQTSYYSSEEAEFYNLESYLYAFYENTWFTSEFRAGRLLIREHDSDAVLLNSGWGYNCMAGIKYRGYDVCLFWEKVDEVIYTGLSVKFASSFLSRSAGKVRLDYNRACEGFVIQYPLFYQDFGLAGEIPAGKKKVGEIKAERVITFWRIGMQRNFYEHIISKWGNTDFRHTEVVIKKEPMLLAIESIVSPVYRFDSLSDLKGWDSNGIRPGQLTQVVTYEFYQ